jgi:hypothetical protein
MGHEAGVAFGSGVGTGVGVGDGVGDGLAMGAGGGVTRSLSEHPERNETAASTNSGNALRIGALRILGSMPGGW